MRPIDKRTGTVQAFAAFPWAEPAALVLDWEVRWPRLLAELTAAAADVVLLQEVQFEISYGDECGSERTSDEMPQGDFVLPAWLRSLCDDAGYDHRIPHQVASLFYILPSSVP